MNKIGDSGVSCISEALKVNNTMNEINFFCVNVFLSPFSVFVAKFFFVLLATINRE